VSVTAKCNRQIEWWYSVTVTAKSNRQTGMLVVECDLDR